MRKGRIIVAGGAAAAVAAGLLTAAALVAPAASATSSSCVSSGKCYLATVAPQSVVGGESSAFAVTVKDEATTQGLGSLQFTAPSGFVITSAAVDSGAAGGTASYTSGSALFLNLGLGPGNTATLTIDATAPCSSSSSGWGIEAKQSNQFNGSGNDFVLDPNSSVSETVSGNCKLAFLGQPHDTMIGKTITTQVGSSGGPVSVEVLDGAGNLVTTSTAQVQVVLNSGPGTLAGTTTVQAIGGVARFSDLSINASAVGDTLEAESTGIAPATSSPFTIWPFMLSCSGSCTGSSSSKTTTGTVTTSATGEFLGVGIGGTTFSCNSPYQPLSDPFSFDVLTSSGTADSGAQFTDILQISKSVVQSSSHPGASTWQICYASVQTFTPQPGTGGTATIDGTVYNTGLLPDCSKSQSAPCVEARTKDNAGNVLVTFLANGDPRARM